MNKFTIKITMLLCCLAAMSIFAMEPDNTMNAGDSSSDKDDLLNTGLESLPPELWELLIHNDIIDSMDTEIGRIFEENVDSNPLKIGTLIIQYFSNLVTKLATKHPFIKNRIKDLSLKNEVKRSVVKLLTKYGQKYNFYEKLKKQLANLTRNQSYTNKDFLFTFRIATLCTDFYNKPENNLKGLINPHFISFIMELINQKDQLFEVFKFLIESPGVDINFLIPPIRVSNIKIDGISSSETMSPLMIAAISGIVPIIKLLLLHPQIDVNLRNSHGRTALLMAVEAACDENKQNTDSIINCIKILLSDPRIDVMVTDKNGKTALEKVQYLLKTTRHGRPLKGIRLSNITKIEKLLISYYNNNNLSLDSIKKINDEKESEEDESKEKKS